MDLQYNLQTKDTLGTDPLSLVERLSSSWRFCFKRIGNFLKAKYNTSSLLNVLF